jgi:lysyl-tRNA synthetase class 1
MKIPDWLEAVLSDFEKRTEPHTETQISTALRHASDDHQDMASEDLKVFQAEWTAFMLMERPKEDSVWGTYFAPMMILKQDDGGEFRSPDIKNLDAETVAHWEDRARSVADPVMKARYADLVWDLKKAITNERPSHHLAQAAADAYIESAEKHFYTSEIEGFQWLSRAFNLSLSLRETQRTPRVVEAIFRLYDKVVTPRLIGVWIIPFDLLYEKKGVLTPEQETKVIADLETMLTKTTSGKPEDLIPFGAQAAAERLAQYYRGKGSRDNVVRVIKTYGEAFERLSKDAGPMLATAWLQPVIERYEQEGLKSDAERLQLLHAEKGKDIRSDLKEFSTTVEISQKEIDEHVEKLIGGGKLHTSLVNVAVGFVPKAKDARKFLEQMRTEAPFFSLFSVGIIEKDGHTSAKIGSVAEDPDGRLHRQLAQTMGIYQPFLALTLDKLRERYAPTVDGILDFLCESPLFANSEKELLRIGLEAYQNGDFVKAVHILVPQVEHILRNFLGMLGVPTLKTVRNHPGIKDAKSMNDVLSDERVREVLKEDLWRYLAVLYTDKRGFNLRNDLAHGLLTLEAFNKPIADRVFHSLLALSLLRVKEQKPEGFQN